VSALYCRRLQYAVKCGRVGGGVHSASAF